MKEEPLWLYKEKNLQKIVNKYSLHSRGRYIELSQHSSEEELDQVKIGNRISFRDGKQGVVSDIEVLRYPKEVQYYFRLEKSLGTILIIK